MKDPEGKKIVTIFFVITVCGILIFSVLWGSFKGEWDALDRSGTLIGVIFGYLLRHYYGT